MPDTATPKPDLIVTGGDVFDPEARSFSRKDVAIAGGRVARIAPAIEVPPGAQRIDATGKIVTSGLIDIHVHAFPWGHLIGLDVDPVSSRSGVTTFVDGGSTGSLNFLAFRQYVIEKTRSNLFALLNVSAIGQASDGIRGVDVYEYDDLRFLHLASAIEVIEKNRDRIVGIKVRMYNGLTTLAPLAAARELADEVALPMVVHLAPPPPSFADILPYLRQGDTITHVYHPGPGAIVDRKGQIRAEYHEARARGVLIDTGTARFHTSFPVVRAAFEQGFFPDTISTDLTNNNVNSITIDLPTTISKYLAFGMKLADALVAVTSAPARALLPGSPVGELREGMPADLAVFAVEEGQFTYRDYFGHTVEGTRRLAHQVTIKDGEPLTPIAQPPMEWDFVKK